MCYICNDAYPVSTIRTPSLNSSVMLHALCLESEWFAVPGGLYDATKAANIKSEDAPVDEQMKAEADLALNLDNMNVF